jgi:hypothetical protein
MPPIKIVATLGSLVQARWWRKEAAIPSCACGSFDRNESAVNDDSDASDDNTILIAVVTSVGGVVLLAALLVAIVCYRRRSQQPENQEELVTIKSTLQMSLSTILLIGRNVQKKKHWISSTHW